MQDPPLPATVEQLLRRAGPAQAGLRATRVRVTEHWLPEGGTRTLAALVDGHGERARLLLTDRIEALAALRADGVDELETLGHALDTPVLDPHKAFPLLPLAIPKPWGRELWYTG
ncbi:MAG TPA: hypothetical protein VLA56_00025, partial [Pseudomonadales bacterium]|nr:hypothetical protein [Pseudomonadales bacterium]